MGERNVSKDLITGLGGGLIGTSVMSQFQNAWRKASQATKTGNSGQGEQERAGQSESEDATMKAAGKLAELAGRHLSHEQKEKLGPIVHYFFGTLQGGVYGGATELAGIDGGFLTGVSFGRRCLGSQTKSLCPRLGCRASQ